MPEVSIVEIAKECGVSISTVSRALNQHPDVKESKRVLIEEAAKRLGYIPNKSARNLKCTDTKCIVILVKGISNPFFTPIIKIFDQELQAKKYSLELQSVDESTDEVNVALEIAKEKRPNGIIFLGGDFSQAGSRLERLNIPFVMSSAGTPIGDEVNLKNCARVVAEDREACCEMMEYLIHYGHKKIGLILADWEKSIGKRRLEGYREALARHQIPYDEKLVYRVEEGGDLFSIENGYQTMKKMLQDQCEFTAVLAMSDTLAFGACRAILESGRRIPEDISVAGFDGIAMGKYATPSITTMNASAQELAEKSMKLLFRLIEGKQTVTEERIDVKLVERESTGPVPQI